jgi:cellobiose phosphorylase
MASGESSAATDASVPSLEIPPASAEPLGHWFDDDAGLPAYEYTGPLCFPDSPREDGKPLLPDDPHFLLGNYRLTLLTHASGLYRIVTGESVWACLNAGDTRGTGENHATVEVAGQTIQLIGIDAPAAVSATKHFGVGFARYSYDLPDGLQIVRKLSVLPSTSVSSIPKIHLHESDFRNGASAFLLQVRFKNKGKEAISFHYRESLRPNYQPILSEGERIPATYKNLVRGGKLSPVEAVNHFLVDPLPPLPLSATIEEVPPVLFVYLLVPSQNRASLSIGPNPLDNPSIGFQRSVTLQPNEEQSLEFVVGYTRCPSTTGSALLMYWLFNRMPEGRHHEIASAFAPAWTRLIPEFSAEPDPVLRCEMRWNAAVLEAMATWRFYYDETVIPQGSMHEYQSGRTTASSDVAQNALPLCHTNPAIARSTLRWLMKRMAPDGEIKLTDRGFGYVEWTPECRSDQQLYFFQLLAEYLRVTKDATILTEAVEFYPRDLPVCGSGLDHVRRAFLFVRDQIGVGSHGIVRRWNSDWNGAFFGQPMGISYDAAWTEGESHMNSTMLVVVLGDLADQVQAHSPYPELTQAMRQDRTQIYQAWLRDLGHRYHSRRAWIDSSTELDGLWLEPQCFALLIPELDEGRKRLILAMVQGQLLRGESMGAPQLGYPTDHAGMPAGTRENGGFWYSLNGPLVLGVDTFDPKVAEELLDRMTRTNFAKHYPQYWTGQWSASDCLNSSKSDKPGLSTAIPYSSHAHAWPLYCYQRLKEKFNNWT